MAVAGAALLLAVGVVVTPVPTAAATGRSVLIVAPHPDDDLLYGAGIVAAALAQGDNVKVVYMTNGDAYDGTPDGYARENEAVQGQQLIGDPESNLIFLGYPDGGMLSLHANYPNSTDRYTTRFGQFATYGNRGLGGADYHFYKFGAHATYNGASVLQDLGSILTTYRPDDVYTTGEADTHSDHEATYWFVQAALLARTAADPTYQPTLHKSIVHWDGGSRWPAAVDPQALMVQPQGLTEPGYAWNERESVPVPLAMQSTNLSVNPKYQAVNAHQSQGGAAGQNGFLGSFVHKDEIFWIDSLGSLPPPVNHAPTADAGPPQTVNAGSVATLDGSGSSDPDGDAITYAWTQTAGPSVNLSSRTAKRPTFTVPAGATSLTFSLVVSDGTLSSSSASVTITVRTAPLTTDTGLQPSEDVGWMNGPQKVSFSVSGGAPPLITYYRIDGSPRQTYGGAFAVSGAGSHTLTYWSVDSVGNQEGAHIGYVNIDVAAPTISSDADTRWHRAAVSVHLSAADSGGSGVAEAQYRVRGSTTWLNAAGDAFTVSGAGIKVYEFRALDGAGNASRLGTCTVRIDTTRPQTKAPYRASVRSGAKVTLEFKVLDARPSSGAATVTLKVRALKGQLVKTFTLKNRKLNSLQSYRFRCTLTKGTYRFYVYATDLAGNTQSEVAHNTLWVR